MATIVLTAVGTALGGPMGGAIGSLIGSQFDAAVFGSGNREGPRLQELAVTTSSYGSPVPRHFGTMRSAGSIIWATDLVESSEEVGGKGQPSTTTYSYSTSFAVALSSRPVLGIKRIWADGNLLRGEAGDLKVAGKFRLHHGWGDQGPDPLIAAAEGDECPAFRGLAYCVFEDLQLADFGNRIPGLSFEIIADNGEVSLAELITPENQQVSVDRSLARLQGFSDVGGPLQATLDTVDRVYPLACDASGQSLSLFDGQSASAPALALPDAAVDLSSDSFGGVGGKASQRRADVPQVPTGLRYYDTGRDYQPGLQRAGGQAKTGHNRIVEFPGALEATTARRLADDAAERAGWSQDRLAYRVAELNPAIGPGQIVTAPGRSGKWRVEAWEWRENGLELELMRLPHSRTAEMVTDPGRSLRARDRIGGTTLLAAFELPWDGSGSADQRQLFAAASSAAAGWTGATLYAESSGSLIPIGATGARRSITGKTTSPLSPSAAVILDRQATLEVQLHAEDLSLTSALAKDLTNGANRALVGEEIIQFGTAENLGEGRWRLHSLLRGRGGTEHFAAMGAVTGSSFVLLDQRPVALADSDVGASDVLAAIGLLDEEPVTAKIIGLGSSRKPLTPVHGRARITTSDELELCWTRRARGAWAWDSSVDVPLNEQSELYEVGIGDTDAPYRSWKVTRPAFVIDAATHAELRATHSEAAIWVRQIGSYARSEALLLTNIS